MSRKRILIYFVARVKYLNEICVFNEQVINQKFRFLNYMLKLFHTLSFKCENMKWKRKWGKLVCSY